MKRNVLNSPRLSELKKKRKRAVFNKFFILLFGLLTIFILLTYLSRLDSLNIAEIQITGNKIVDSAVLKGAVGEQIAGKYLWLFPKTNTLIYPQSAIKNGLQDKFKRIGDINLSIKNNTVLEVSIIEREAKYTWCGVDSPETASGAEISTGNQKCYFLDEDGYAFDEAPYFSGNVYFKFYGLPAQAGSVENPLGSYFSKQNFKELISFKDTLVAMGLKPMALYVTNNGDMEIFLSRENTNGTMPKIIFKGDADFKNIAENLQAALHTEPLQSKFKNNYSALEYIDLRFENKVFDKFSVQGESAPVQ